MKERLYALANHYRLAGESITFSKMESATYIQICVVIEFLLSCQLKSPVILHLSDVNHNQSSQRCCFFPQGFIARGFSASLLQVWGSFCCSETGPGLLKSSVCAAYGSEGYAAMERNPNSALRARLRTLTLQGIRPAVLLAHREGMKLSLRAVTWWIALAVVRLCTVVFICYGHSYLHIIACFTCAPSPNMIHIQINAPAICA